MELHPGGLKGISQLMKWERAPKKRSKCAQSPRCGESRVGRENDRGIDDWNSGLRSKAGQVGRGELLKVMDKPRPVEGMTPRFLKESCWLSPQMQSTAAALRQAALSLRAQAHG